MPEMSASEKWGREVIQVSIVNQPKTAAFRETEKVGLIYWGQKVSSTMTKLEAKIRRHPAVQDVFSEFGNIRANYTDWWVWLKPGWMSDPETHTIHEESLTACWKQLRMIVPCGCQDCDQGREEYMRQNSGRIGGERE